MATLTAVAAQTDSRNVVTEGVARDVAMWRDGSLVTVDFVARLAAAGLVYVANFGTVTTPVTFGAGTIDSDEFDAHVAVPGNLVVIPLSMRLVMEAFGTTAIFEAMMGYGTGSVVGANGSAVTPLNVNMQKANSSGLTCTAGSDDGGTALSNIREIWRETIQAAATIATGNDTSSRNGHTFTWSWKDDGVLHFVGPSAQLAVWAASQAGTGFITLTFAVVPSTMFI